MKFTRDFDDFEPWGQAEEIFDRIAEEGKLDELESLLEGMYTDELPTETQINDLLAYDWEWVFDMLGIEEEDEEEEDDDD